MEAKQPCWLFCGDAALMAAPRIVANEEGHGLLRAQPKTENLWLAQERR